MITVKELKEACELMEREMGEDAFVYIRVFDTTTMKYKDAPAANAYCRRDGLFLHTYVEP